MYNKTRAFLIRYYRKDTVIVISFQPFGITE